MIGKWKERQDEIVTADKVKKEILDVLPEKIAVWVLRIVAPFGGDVKINEIRIRAGRPLAVVIDGKEHIAGYVAGPGEPTEIFVRLCKNSPYAFSEDIKNGFITLPGGHRVGIAGKVLQSGSIREISGLNIRISGEIKGCGEKVMAHVAGRDGRIYNTLVISPPCGGKTTLIRDIARLLSDGWKGVNGSFEGVNVGIVDERSEIAAMQGGMPRHDVGRRTDVYDGCSKQKGIFMMLRAMSPKVIVTDEIGGEGDFAALESAMNSGVKIIATAHGCSVEDIKARRVIANMIREGFFEKYIILSGTRGPGTVERLC